MSWIFPGASRSFADTFASMRPQCPERPCQKTPGHQGAHWAVQEADDEDEDEQVAEDEDEMVAEDEEFC